MYWEIKSKYYSIIVRFNYKKMNYYYIQMYFEKYFKSTWNYRGRRYEWRARYTPLRRVDGMWNTFSGRFSRFAENATDVIYLALHSVSHALKSMWNVYACERDRTNLAILDFSAMIDLLEKRREHSSAEFLEEELRSRLLSEWLNVTEKFRLQILLSTVLFHMLLNQPSFQPWAFLYGVVATRPGVFLYKSWSSVGFRN